MPTELMAILIASNDMMTETSCNAPAIILGRGKKNLPHWPSRWPQTTRVRAFLPVSSHAMRIQRVHRVSSNMLMRQAFLMS
jgi:hypothetical protein